MASPAPLPGKPTRKKARKARANKSLVDVVPPRGLHELLRNDELAALRAFLKDVLQIGVLAPFKQQVCLSSVARFVNDF